LQILHKFLMFNVVLINFWLESIILPAWTKQFPQNLRRTAWHMASSPSGKVHAALSGICNAPAPLMLTDACIPMKNE
jgi:hypothetical protein